MYGKHSGPGSRKAQATLKSSSKNMHDFFRNELPKRLLTKAKSLMVKSFFHVIQLAKERRIIMRNNHSGFASGEDFYHRALADVIKTGINFMCILGDRLGL